MISARVPVTYPKMKKAILRLRTQKYQYSHPQHSKSENNWTPISRTPMQSQLVQLYEFPKTKASHCSSSAWERKDTHCTNIQGSVPSSLTTNNGVMECFRRARQPPHHLENHQELVHYSWEELVLQEVKFRNSGMCFTPSVMEKS